MAVRLDPFGDGDGDRAGAGALVVALLVEHAGQRGLALDDHEADAATDDSERDEHRDRSANTGNSGTSAPQRVGADYRIGHGVSAESA